MRWVYLSPHFDDVVLSCGGLVWEQVQAGQPVEVWTVCAGAPSPEERLSDFALSLHRRWGTGLEAVDIRRQEDEAALQRLGAQTRYWDLPDCIYRKISGGWLVNGEEDLWRNVHDDEQPVVDRLVGWMNERLRPDDVLVSPMTLGNHVDHFLVRAAAERLMGMRQKTGAARILYFYADYPYAVQANAMAGKLDAAWQKQCFPVSEQAVAVWQAAVACYETQISTFWGGLEEMRAALATYWQDGGGTCLWKASSW